MGTVASYHRSPLMDTGFAPVADASIHTRGPIQQMIENVLGLVDRNNLSPMEAVLATKLGGYKTAPQINAVEELPDCTENLYAFTQQLRAEEMVAVMNHDREGLIQVLLSMQQFKCDMMRIGEKELFENGAELWRLSIDLYRRTGQSFLLDLMSELRSRLTDVSGVMHSFPFQTAYTPVSNDEMGDNRSYYERMNRLATSRLMADSAAMTALISQYSGDRRDVDSPKLALEHLKRYHMLSGGAVSGDPYLSGSDPSQSAEICSVCAQMEAWLDSLLLTGDSQFAEQMELLFENVLSDMIFKEGIRAVYVPNRLFADESCTVQKPTQKETSALLRALYAMRRSTWLWKDDHTVCCAQPYSGMCTLRVENQSIRLVSEVTGNEVRRMNIRIDCHEPASFAISIRIPSYCKSAEMQVNGKKIQPDFQKGYATVDQSFFNGDVISLEMTDDIRLETGKWDTVSVYLGPWLMALPVPSNNSEWRFALNLADSPALNPEGHRTLLVKAGSAEKWNAENGLIGVPPRNVKLRESFELTLQPAAGLQGRITAFPRVRVVEK